MGGGGGGVGLCGPNIVLLRTTVVNSVAIITVTAIITIAPTFRHVCIYYVYIMYTYMFRIHYILTVINL